MDHEAPVVGEPGRRRHGMPFYLLVVHNLGTKMARTALTAAAVAVSVMAIVALTVVTDSLQQSAASVLRAGSADFSVAQKGSPGILDSVVTDTQVSQVAATPGVESAVGALISTTRLDASHPVFLEIGIRPTALQPFGVAILSGRPFSATASDEVMLGWQAAQDLHKQVGDTLRLDQTDYRIVGLYSIKQVFGDTASMLPLIPMQAYERKPGTVTLIAVKVRPGVPIEVVRHRIERDHPNLATVRLASEYGRVDRNITFLNAARTGATIIALLIGVIIVMNTMLLSFIERIREFGLLRALGWSRQRLVGLVMGEALGISLLGAAGGVSMAFLLTATLARFSSLHGLLQPQYSASTFGIALYSAVGIGLLAALYPCLRAAFLRPGDALRRE